MPRTDKEISEYVRYYAQQGKRKWAVEMLSKTEGKTAEEIEHICYVENGKQGAQSRLTKPPKYSEELFESVAADKAAGMSYKEIADKYQMPLKTINSIFAIISRNKKKAAEAEQKEQEQAAAALVSEALSREPEAYPGQIHDEEPESVVESDVKVFIPGELPLNVEDCEVHIPASQQLHAPAKNVWFALRDELRDFAVGVFGAGTEIISERVNSSSGHAVIEIRTADGDTITLSAIKYSGNDYTGGSTL